MRGCVLFVIVMDVERVRVGGECGGEQFGSGGGNGSGWSSSASEGG